MDMINFDGLLIGIATFLIIGLFHPVVVKAEYYWGTKCWWIFLVLGIAGTVASLLVESVFVSAICGVFAFSSFWTIKEVFEQEERAFLHFAPIGLPAGELPQFQQRLDRTIEIGDRELPVVENRRNPDGGIEFRHQLPAAQLRLFEHVGAAGEELFDLVVVPRLGFGGLRLPAGGDQRHADRVEELALERIVLLAEPAGVGAGGGDVAADAALLRSLPDRGGSG